MNKNRRIEEKGVQTFKCGPSKITVDARGYIVKVSGLEFIMWSNHSTQQECIGKHITEFAKLLKQYGASKQVYYGFITNVIPQFYDKFVDPKQTVELLKQDLEQRLGMTYQTFESLRLTEQKQLLEQYREEHVSKVKCKRKK